MPSIRDYSQDYANTATATQIAPTPDVQQNDLIVATMSCDSATANAQWMGGENMTSCIQYNLATHVDYSPQISSEATGDVYLTAATAALNHVCYFGHTSIFNGLTLVVSTAGAGTQTWGWQYWNGTAWTTLTQIGTSTIILTATAGPHSTIFNPPSDWATFSVNGGTAMYYIRMIVTAYTSQTTRPAYTRGWIGTFNQILTINNGTTANTSPMHAVAYKIAGATETDFGYQFNENATTPDTKNCAVISVKDVDTLIPFATSSIVALSTTDSNQAVYTGSVVGVSQSFTSPAVLCRLATAKFYLKKVGSPTGNVTVKLYAQAAGVIPTGIALAISNVYDIASLTTSYQLIEFTFPWYYQYQFAASTVYTVAVEYSGGDASNYLHVAYNSTSSGAGNKATLTGTTWTAQATQDCYFDIRQFAFTTSTDATYRFAFPTMTTERNNSMVLYAMSDEAVSVPSIIEGPVTSIVGKDGNAHADAWGWGWQKTAGTTPATIYCSRLGTSSLLNCASVVAINPPSSGATVIPGYCVSDASVYINPLTGVAYGSDSAPAALGTVFGTTLNGKPIAATSTTYTLADTGVNTYHAMRANTTVAAIATSWYGSTQTIASRDLSGKNLLFHIQPATPIAIQTTDSVALAGACGVAIGLCSTSGTYRSTYHVGGANSSWGIQRHQPVIINTAYTGAGRIEIGTSGAVVDTAVINIGTFVSGKVVATSWLFGSMWALDTTVVAGGNSTFPLDIPQIIRAAADGHERRSIISEGAGQFMIFQPLQIGDGGTNPVYLNLDSTALEFPKQYDVATKNVGYCSVDNVAGLKYYPGASDTIIHKNSIVSSSSKYHWGLHASASTSATYDFSGLSVIGAGTITLGKAITLTELTINGYSTLDATGLTLTNSSILGCPTANDSLTLSTASNIDYCSINTTGIIAGNRLCSITDPTIFSYTAFTGSASTGHAMRISTLGAPTSFDLYGNTFTNYGANGSTSAAILNDSGQAITINVYGGGNTPTYKNLAAGSTTTIVVGLVDTTITVKSLSTGSAIENARVLVTVANNNNYPYHDSVTITGSGTTATVAHTGHRMVTGDKIVISGVTNDDVYNGVFTITKTSDNAYTYTTANAITSATATGTIIATFAVISGLTNASGIITDTRSWASAQVITGWVRKSTSAPYYQQGAVAGTISTSAGFLTTIQMILDE